MDWGSDPRKEPIGFFLNEWFKEYPQLEQWMPKAALFQIMLLEKDIARIMSETFEDVTTADLPGIQMLLSGLAMLFYTATQVKLKGDDRPKKLSELKFKVQKAINELPTVLEQFRSEIESGVATISPTSQVAEKAWLQYLDKKRSSTSVQSAES